jgi:hypothetical protein
MTIAIDSKEKQLKIEDAEIINYAPHSITIYDAFGNPLVIESAGTARIGQNKVDIGLINNLRITRTDTVDLARLPKPNGRTFYIVSRKYMNAFSRIRNDLLIPDDVIKDERDYVIACKALSIN